MIFALATPVAQSAIAVFRISGNGCCEKFNQLLKTPVVEYRKVFLRDVYAGSELVDRCSIVFYSGPSSYTGEDSVEIFCHGGLSVIKSLSSLFFDLGIREAGPGEFSRLAFENGKLTLNEAEAVADLIHSEDVERGVLSSEAVAGKLSSLIRGLGDEVDDLRVFVEGSIDFSDEEIDFLESHEVSSKLYSLKLTLLNILESANQGAILRDGIHVAIAGKPNAGKSSLLNSLTKQPSAIVTDVAGTTRDVLKETIQIDGMPIHIIDTAGLHNSDNIIEQEGIRRAHTEINNADVVLLVYDASDKSVDLSILPESVKDKPKIVIKNKIDLTGSKTGIQKIQNNPEISISAKNGDGINIVRKALADFAGLNSNTEGVFLARKRHIIAINETLSFINSATSQLDGGASELVAEDLRQAGMHLGQITGEFSSDDLLGQIFSSFCIGK